MPNTEHAAKLFMQSIYGRKYNNGKSFTDYPCYIYISPDELFLFAICDFNKGIIQTSIWSRLWTLWKIFSRRIEQNASRYYKKTLISWESRYGIIANNKGGYQGSYQIKHLEYKNIV